MGKYAERVRIARDVLHRLTAKTLRARPGVYVRSKSRIVRDLVYTYHYAGVMPDLERTALGNRAATAPKVCSACIKGGLLVAAVDRYNELYIRDITDDLDNNKTCTSYLNRWFPREELNLMESIFEMDDEHMRDYLLPGVGVNAGSRRAVKCAQFRKRALSRSHVGTQAEKVMRAVMNNVVRNEGYFRITQ